MGPSRVKLYKTQRRRDGAGISVQSQTAIKLAKKQSQTGLSALIIKETHVVGLCYQRFMSQKHKSIKTILDEEPSGADNYVSPNSVHIL
jgi:hypothetical protein